VVGFEWDEECKAGIDFRKHGVRMPEAIPVFDEAIGAILRGETTVGCRVHDPDDF